MKTGPDIERDGLAFGYDSGAQLDANSNSNNLSRGRFFKGPNHTNVLEVHNNSQSSTTTNYSFVYGTEEVKIPKIGKRTVKYCDYNNNRYDENGNVNSGTSCCPNLFYYHGSSPYIQVDSSTSYTYSIVYKHSANYTHPNFMYRYEYNGTSYVKEGGLHSSSRRTHLGGGWYHAWGSFTTNSSTDNLRCYSFLYNYGLQTNRFHVAHISLVKNVSGATHLIIPPHLLQEPSDAVVATSSLIDLKRTTDISVQNISFNSFGHPTFDGTDDSIAIPSVTLGNGNWTLEFVANAHNSGYHMMSNSSGGPVANAMGVLNNKMHYKNYNGSWQSINSSTTVNYNQIYHLVYVNRAGSSTTNGTMDMYINGEKDSNSGTNSYTTNGGPVNAIGRSWAGYFDGDIHICKRYTRGLSDKEVKQNFNAYRKRFKL